MAKAKKPRAKPSTKKPKSLPKAMPPPDDPLRRFQDLNVDRRLQGAAERPRAGARSVAMAAPAKGKRGARGTASRVDTETHELARLRLVALEHSREMLLHAAGAPVLTATPRTATMDAAPVAPIAGTSNWVQMGPTAIPNGQTYTAARVMVTGRVTAIVVDPTNPQVIYLGAAQGGVWKSTDGGNHWAPTGDNEISLAIGALVMDPSNPQVLYAGTGEGNFSQDSYYGDGVLKSTNGGGSWTALATSTFLRDSFSRLAVTPGTPDRLFAATYYGLYRSTDGGTNWDQLLGTAVSAATDVAIDPLTPTTVYAAFWGQGIYRTTNADAASPSWTKLAGGLPVASTPAPGGFTRVALGVSPSSPQTLYALFANNDTTSPPPGPPYAYAVDKFYVSNDGGNSWSPITLPAGPGTGIGGQGFYNLNVAVDPSTPDIVYLSGISLWKATRSTTTGLWSIADIGGAFHPDNHALAFDPTNHLVLYAGSDGGIYKSTDGGTTWSDAINSGLCITQFEFLVQHPTSDAVVFGGTQDNGTEQFRNSPVFYHSDEGDGGFTAIDPNTPANVLGTYYGPSPKRSTQAGAFGSWLSLSGGLTWDTTLPEPWYLFYPPMALDETNPNNIAFGTNLINLDAAQGTGSWPVKVTLPGIVGNVSSIHYVNSSLIYAATTTGQVYRLLNSGPGWTATAIHASPLPVNRWIWDLRARPDNRDVVIVVISGFSIAHVWRGDVPATGPAVWTNISGTGAGTTLPDIPVNAVAIDPQAPDTYYIGTDIAVYRTANAGTQWTQFSQGLPNCAIFDVHLHAPTRLLRVGTHGRGMWERRLDVASMPDVDLFVRDNLMDTGRLSPSPSNVAAAFADPLQAVALGDILWWWQCADIKVDALEGTPPAYQMPVAAVDYVAFESQLVHRNPQRGRVNRIYVQVHNRGIQPGAAVTVKVLAAAATAGLPPLPPDFWTAFPGNSLDTSQWMPVGAAKTVATLSPTEPAVVEWDWTTPPDAADHTCLLVVVDSPSNPIPAPSKVFDVGQLVTHEKHIGLKNLHVVSVPPGMMHWTPFRFFGTTDAIYNVKIISSAAGAWKVGLLLPKAAPKGIKFQGTARRKLNQQELGALLQRLENRRNDFDTTNLYVVSDLKKGGVLTDLKLARSGLEVMLLLVAPSRGTSSGTLTILQERGQTVVGGSTFVLSTTKKRS